MYGIPVDYVALVNLDTVLVLCADVLHQMIGIDNPLCSRFWKPTKEFRL